ncbi:MAG: hypothetical protein AAF624_07780 [Bacteroidota bacterium]
MLATASLLRVGVSLSVLAVLGPTCSQPSPASVSSDSGSETAVPFQLVYEAQRGLDCPVACVTRLTLTEDGMLTYLRSDGAASGLAVVDTAFLATSAQDSVQALLDGAGFFALPAQLPEQITGFSGSTARIRYESAARSHTVAVLPDALTAPGHELAPAVRLLLADLRASLLRPLGLSSDGLPTDALRPDALLPSVID